jgi:hypothetical protein
MRYWTIKQQIILGLSILILINFVVGLFTSSGISKLKSFVENISSSELSGVYVIGQVQASENETYQLMLQYILAGTRDEADSYNSRLTETGSHIDTLLATYEQNSVVEEQEKAKLQDIVSTRAAFQTAWAPVRELSANLKIRTLSICSNSRRRRRLKS